MNTHPPSVNRPVSPGPQSWYRKLPVFGPVVDEVLTWFRRHGYAESTIHRHLNGMSLLTRWLQRRRGTALRGLTQLDLRSAYDSLRVRRPDVASTARVLARFFSEERLLPAGKAAEPLASERELDAHAVYLGETRGLAASTIEGHQIHLRFFLKFLKYDQNPCVIRTLRLDQIESFLCHRATTNTRFSLQHVVASLRSFLQRQHAQGILRQPLHRQIDMPRTYRLEKLPRALRWDKVVALLRSIDRTDPDGLRKFTLFAVLFRTEKSSLPYGQHGFWPCLVSPFSSGGWGKVLDDGLDHARRNLSLLGGLDGLPPGSRKLLWSQLEERPHLEFIGRPRKFSVIGQKLQPLRRAHDPPGV